MAVLIEAISVVIRADAITRKFRGGWEAFKSIVPNRTLCADNEVVRLGFMSLEDVESFVKTLQGSGLEFLCGGKAIDIAVADQIRGITSRCDWLEFGHVGLGDEDRRVAACRLAGSSLTEVVTPPDWKFEGSLSSTYGFAPSEDAEKALKFLRHERGLDVYFNPLAGKEVYVGRTRK